MVPENLHALVESHLKFTDGGIVRIRNVCSIRGLTSNFIFPDNEKRKILAHFSLRIKEQRESFCYQYHKNSIIIMIIIILIIIVLLQCFMFRMKAMDMELANGEETSSLSVTGIMPTLLILKISC